MEHVEGLLADLLASWEVDVYVRLEATSRPGDFSPRASVGISDPAAARLASSEIVRDACERAFETTTPVIVARAADEAGSDAPVSELGVRTIAAFPADPGSRAAGVLLFGSRKADSFSRSTLELLPRFAGIVACYAGEKDRAGTQLRRLVIQLTEAEDRERSRIASLLHDDLQQTLAGIKVHIDMAARRAGGEPFVGERLETAVTLLEQAIDRARTLSHELSPPVLSARGFVPALKMLANETERIHGLQVLVESPADRVEMSELASVVAYRAVQELLFNIVKHAGVDEARVEVAPTDEGLYIVVRDHGEGFDVDVVMNHDSPVGLGLVSIRERVDAIGGTLEIESSPGTGSIFSIFLPPEAMRAQGTRRARTGALDATAREGRSTTVLLVDDHAVIRQGLAFLLNEEPDLEVVGEADTGTSALEMVRELMPDVVVMDLTMPGMSGDEATRRVRREAPLIRVVGLSMHSDDEARERMLSAGADAYLPKAGPSSELVAAIRGERPESA